MSCEPRHYKLGWFVARDDTLHAMPSAAYHRSSPLPSSYKIARRRREKSFTRPRGFWWCFRATWFTNKRSYRPPAYGLSVRHHYIINGHTPHVQCLIRCNMRCYILYDFHVYTKQINLNTYLSPAPVLFSGSRIYFLYSFIIITRVFSIYQIYTIIVYKSRAAYWSLIMICVCVIL